MSGKNGLQTDKKRVSVRGSRLVSVQLGTKLLGRRAFIQIVAVNTHTALPKVGTGAGRASVLWPSIIVAARGAVTRDRFEATW